MVIYFIEAGDDMFTNKTIRSNNNVFEKVNEKDSEKYLNIIKGENKLVKLIFSDKVVKVSLEDLERFRENLSKRFMSR